MLRSSPFLTALFSTLVCTVSSPAAVIREIEVAPAPTPLELRFVGRTVTTSDTHGATVHRLQWPGVYFEAAFTGGSVLVEMGDGRAIFHVTIDDQPALNLTSAHRAWYEISGLSAGSHTIRVELVTECQGGAVDVIGLAVRGATSAKPASVRPPPARRRQIEFIGDSYTVGYGNMSPKRQCTPDEQWAATDTSQSFAPLVGKHFRADYQVNAISGRGIVRNYDGFVADSLVEAYPFALFDHAHRVDEAGWSPDIIVIGLGSNDFSTKLKPGEKWKTRDDLRRDFEQTYVRFVAQLRALHPGAFILLEGDDTPDREIAAEVRNVIALLEAGGEKRLGYVEFDHLELTACDWHPSLKDHLMMAAAVEHAIDARSDAWAKPSPAR